MSCRTLPSHLRRQKCLQSASGLPRSMLQFLHVQLTAEWPALTSERQPIEIVLSTLQLEV